MRRIHPYGQRPPDISFKILDLGLVNGVRRINLASARASHWHRHEDTTLLGCIKGDVTYEFHNIPPVTLKAGYFLIIPANVEHRHLSEIDPVCHRIELLLPSSGYRPARYMLFPSSVARTLHVELLRQAMIPCKCSQDVLASLTELSDFAKIVHQGISDTDLGYVRTLILRILFGVTRRHTPRKKAASTEMIDAMFNWVDTHFNESLSIDRIVSKLGFSRTHIFTLFKERCGLTPADYITRLRIRTACDMLKNPAASSKAVAEACGFHSPSNFNAVFKRQTGRTPTQWRIKLLTQSAAVGKA